VLVNNAGPLGFNRSRGVFSGPVWRRSETTRPYCDVMRRSRLSRETANCLDSAATQSEMVPRDMPPIPVILRASRPERKQSDTGQ